MIKKVENKNPFVVSSLKHCKDCTKHFEKANKMNKCPHCGSVNYKAMVVNKLN